MAIETPGTVQMKSDGGPGIQVSVLVDDIRIRLVSGNELIGEWDLQSIGVHVLNNGFSIRAEGEEFVLRTKDDVGVAEELGVVASTPRMARRVAASHPPEDRLFESEEVDVTWSNLPAITYALAGALILAGGVFLNVDSNATASGLDGGSDVGGGGRFWLALVVGGALMVGVAYLLAIGSKVARITAIVLLIGMIVLFGLAAQEARLDADELLAYGFIAGGIVVGVAVVFSDSLPGGDDSD